MFSRQASDYSHFKNVRIAGDVARTGNGIDLISADASAAPQIAAVGDDTNVDLVLVAKGTGAVAITQSSGVAVTPVISKEASFTETSGAGTYTGSVAVPAGASIHDILINGVALWNSAGACTLKVGDVADDDGYYTGVDLKATDLLAGESLSFALAGGKAGAYIANSQVSPRYSATARVVSGIITQASGTGTLGRTRMTVVYSLPRSADVTAATKV